MAESAQPPARGAAAHADGLHRCPWPGVDPLYLAYHDEEWGAPEWDDRALFEKLALDGFQAGLAWITILRKRAAFRAAFDGFDPERVARYDERKVAALLADAGIVRHRGKIEATIGLARVTLDLRRQGGLAKHLWSFVDGRPIQNRWGAIGEVPAQTPEAAEMAKALKAKGFKFCGPVIVYAFMQAVGMVNDHVTSCPRHADVAALARPA